MKEIFQNLYEMTAFSNIIAEPQFLIMYAIAFLLLYLGIKKQYEPLLLIPIAFGVLLANFPGGEMGVIQADENGFINVHGVMKNIWEMPLHDIAHELGLMNFIYYMLIKTGFLPPIIFMGVGALTDFGPMLRNLRLSIFGAAAQLGIFTVLLVAIVMGFTPKEAASLGIIGGADGPTAIWLTSRLAPDLLGAIAVAAYSYMALVPIIQPFAIKLVTTKKERCIKMPYNPKSVSKTTRILFPIIVTFIAGLVAPMSVSLVGFLMFGNLIRECGVLQSLSETAQNQLANLITLLLGITISFSMRAEQFVSVDTIMIMAIGLVAFIFDTIGGVLFAKLLNLFRRQKINPMIGAAGISAFPMSSRVVQKMALKEDPSNILIMHAAGANVSGQIASVVAGGMVMSLLANYL